MVEAIGRAGGIHLRRILAQQRIYLAAFLIALCAPLGAQDFSFDPEITQEEFRQFSRAISQAIYASPVEPATNRGLLAFDIGVAATAIEIDEDAAFWVNSVDSDLLTDGYLVVPRLVVSKGLVFANLSGMYAKIPDSDVEIWGAALDVPILRGGVAMPTLSIRGTWADVRGVEELDLTVYGAEVFISKGFGPFTPYAAAGIARTDSEGRIPETAVTPAMILQDEFDQERFTVGLRISLLVPKLVIEATQAEDISYAAKISFGL
ncbi:MAG TPA: hypothetical protein VMS12_09020 [Thermoanaerobaculia bacterium]|nr:hypothetical protein [Thermoanaerobaculia bacterium]